MTSGGARIAAAIERARAAGRPAVAAFVTHGFPSRRAFPSYLRAAARAADVLEIGVPFSDPMADGLTIQRASRVALEEGATLRGLFELLEDEPADGGPPIALMSYVNPLLAFGVEALARAARRTSVAALVVPDLPLEEQERLRVPLAAEGIGLVQLVAPTTPLARARRLASATDGFLYAVALRGTTGGALRDRAEVADRLAALKRESAAPVLAGFGVRTPDDVRALCPPADGVVVGSALLEAIERSADPEHFLLEMAGR